MKIAIAHNRYQQAGGEDKVVAAEAAMLERHGHRLEMAAFDNEAIQGPWAQTSAAISSFYSLPAYRRMRAMLSAFRPDVLHVHNFLPAISPSIFFAAERARVPVVFTAHNFRLICANGVLFRAGHVCEECPEQRSFLPGVRYACYRNSHLGSAVVGGTMAMHEALGTWRERVTRYIVLTRFAAGRLGASRVPAERIRVKPNFVVDRGGDTVSENGRGGFALFVGRLSEEKGIETLLAADALGRLPLPVFIAGDGPLRPQLEAACARPESRLTAIGHKPEAEVLALMRQATVLVVPSVCYEGFPVVMAEALSVGLPVIASRIGGLPEIVEDHVVGLLFPPGDPDALSAALERFAQLPEQAKAEMRAAARQRFLDHYGEAANHGRLMQIYEEAIEVS